MKVLVITGLFPSRQNPAWGVHVLNNVRALSKVCEVRVVAPVRVLPLFGVRGPGYANGAPPLRDHIADIAVAYPRWWTVPLLARPLQARFLIAGIRSTVRETLAGFDADVVLAYFAYPYGVAAVMLGDELGLPVVVSCRGSDINRMAEARAQRRSISRSLRRADAVIAVSKSLAEAITRLGVPAERLHVITNGIDSGEFHPTDRLAARSLLGRMTERRLAVCVSRLSPEKGIDVLLSAWKEVPGAELAVVGDGPQRAELEAQAVSLEIDHRVSFVGAVRHEDIPHWWAAADVAVLPSRIEGYPNAAVEALACGRPVVASRVGGVPEIVRDGITGILVPAEDVGALADGLRRALETPWNPAALAASISSRTWGAVGGETLAVLQDAVRGMR